MTGLPVGWRLSWSAIDTTFGSSSVSTSSVSGSFWKRSALGMAFVPAGGLYDQRFVLAKKGGSSNWDDSTPLWLALISGWLKCLEKRWSSISSNWRVNCLSFTSVASPLVLFWGISQMVSLCPIILFVIGRLFEFLMTSDDGRWLARKQSELDRYHCRCLFHSKISDWFSLLVLFWEPV